jgi:transposase-like protein
MKSYSLSSNQRIVIVWLDAIHYKIKESGRYISKAIYTILGLNIDGKKELLSLYLSDHEGAHHWLSVEGVKITV